MFDREQIYENSFSLSGDTIIENSFFLEAMINSKIYIYVET